MLSHWEPFADDSLETVPKLDRNIIIAYLASASSPHTTKWANLLSQKGYKIHLLSAHPLEDSNTIQHSVEVHRLPFGPPFGYVLNTWHLRQLLKKIRPHFMHAHYASGYGTLARLSGFHTTLLSVWGSDVYLYPYGAIWRKMNLKANLKFADYIASTSHAMGKKTEEFIQPTTPISITPFGVDCAHFSPQQRPGRGITIGTVKTLESVYGIDTLIRGFSILARKLPAFSLRLLIVGKGSQRRELEDLTRRLGIHGMTEFVGAVAHQAVPQYLNQMSIYVCVSNSESFGVSALEASACGVPVIVSDVGGLPEVVQDGITGLIVPKENPGALAIALEKLVCDANLARTMGHAGRDFVLNNYCDQKTVGIMEQLYERIVSGSKGKSSPRLLPAERTVSA